MSAKGDDPVTESQQGYWKTIISNPSIYLFGYEAALKLHYEDYSVYRFALNYNNKKIN